MLNRKFVTIASRCCFLWFAAVQFTIDVPVRAEEGRQTKSASSVYQSAVHLGAMLGNDGQQDSQNPQKTQPQAPQPTPPIQSPQAQADAPAEQTKDATAAPPGAVQIRVAVLENRKNGNHHFKRNLEKNLKIFEDGVEQDAKIVQLDNQPVTIAYVFEWRSILPDFAFVSYWQYEEYFEMCQSMLDTVIRFMQKLNEDRTSDELDNSADSAAVVSYNDWRKADCESICRKKKGDKKRDCEEIQIPKCRKDNDQQFRWKWITDFTSDPNNVVDGLNRLRALYFPYSSESDINDTLGEVVGRMKKVQGLKTIVVVGTGIDTFSGTYRSPKEMETMLGQSGIQVFTVGTGQVLSDWMDAWCQYATGQPCDIVQSIQDWTFKIPRKSDFDTGDAYLGELSKVTGGRHFQPRDFGGEMDRAFDRIYSLARNEYLVTYIPHSKASPHRLEVKLIDEHGHEMLDRKGKAVSAELFGKDGKPAKFTVAYPESRPAVE